MDLPCWKLLLTPACVVGLDKCLSLEMVSAAPASEELLRSEVRHLHQAGHVGLVNSFMIGFPAGCAIFKTRSLLVHTEGPVLGYAHFVSMFSNFRRFGYLMCVFSFSSFPFSSFWQVKQIG